MREQGDGMLRLIEKLRETDVFMSLNPDIDFGKDHIRFTFRKTGRYSAVPFHKYIALDFEEVQALKVEIEDILIDQVDVFLKEFEKNEALYASKRFNKE